MNTSKTECIILRRVNYRDNDRIVNAITKDMGKVSFIAKGVRKEKSKLVGGIELLSLSEVSLLKGKSEMYTLISARLKEHFGDIVKNLERTNIAYKILKVIDKSTEDDAEEEYYNLTARSLSYLNDQQIFPGVLEVWFFVRLFGTLGMELNTTLNAKGIKLQSSKNYSFDYEDMTFSENENGEFDEKHLKLLRLYGELSPKKIMSIENIEDLNVPIAKLINNASQVLLRR